MCESKTGMDAKVLGEDQEASLVHATCRRCGSSTLSLVMALGEAATSLALVTDLSADDVLRFRDAPEVTVDDVIELHAFAEGKGLASLVSGIVPKKKRARIRTKTQSKRP